MLKLENLSVNINGKQILHNINLHIKPGEVHVLFGPNGVGKSTIIGTIMGFSRYEVTNGKIFFKGVDITESPVYERAKLGIGVMIQRPPTISGLKLRDMIKICGANEDEIEIMAKEMKLDGFLDRPVNDGFSGGEIKRSELLQLMAQQPDLLLLDEPESGVDIESIALVGKISNYIINGGREKKYCCKKKNKIKRKTSVECNCAGVEIGLEEKNENAKCGLIITHLGHILKYVPSDIAHIIYDGTLVNDGNPYEMLNGISKNGYESFVKSTGARRNEK